MKWAALAKATQIGHPQPTTAPSQSESLVDARDSALAGEAAGAASSGACECDATTVSLRGKGSSGMQPTASPIALAMRCSYSILRPGAYCASWVRSPWASHTANTFGRSLPAGNDPTAVATAGATPPRTRRTRRGICNRRHGSPRCADLKIAVASMTSPLQGPAASSSSRLLMIRCLGLPKELEAIKLRLKVGC